MSVRLAIVYYSTYGTNHRMVEIAAEAARAAGAEVRMLKAPETAPANVVAGVDPWKAHAEATAAVPTVTAADMEWADAYLISAPTRFGVMASRCAPSSTPSAAPGPRVRWPTRRSRP